MDYGRTNTVEDSEEEEDAVFVKRLPLKSHALHAFDTSSSSESDDDPSAQLLKEYQAAIQRSSLESTTNAPVEPRTKFKKSSLIRESEKTAQLAHPKSRYEDHVPPLPICQERTVLRELLSEAAHQGKGQDYTEIDLDDFSMYLPENRHHSFELHALSDLASKVGHGSFLFDGILSTGDLRRYVQGVPFKICSIGNYGEDIHEVGDDIWIQSDINIKSNVYYRLKSPTSEYARYHEGFRWSADLAKHFVDYCQACAEELKTVSVFNFKSNFAQWLRKTHAGSAAFQVWYKKYNSEDFRHAVEANIFFLYKESVGVNVALRKQPIWSQLLEKDFIPLQKIKCSKTIVTPYVYECFKDARFGDLLQSVMPTSSVLEQCRLLGTNFDFMANVAARQTAVEMLAVNATRPGDDLSRTVEAASESSAAARERERRQKVSAIKVGDVLAVPKDGHGSIWKDEASRWKAVEKCWYIYVQHVHENNRGQRSFEGIWLYKPSDTFCAKMKYPYPNELFLSDNCTCKHERIFQEEVLDVVKVIWYSQPLESGEYLFVRQTYLENERFVSLQDIHKKCEHFQRSESSQVSENTRKYSIGQTVLAPPPDGKPKYGLEPYEVDSYVQKTSKTFVLLRRLFRRGEFAGQNCKANELVYSDKIFTMESKKIQSTCLVRFYSEADVLSRSIPTPYDRDGTGNAFYITTRLVEMDGSQELSPIHEKFPGSLLQGFDPLAPLDRKVLRGLDLYCGGGNLGRGLEEGGVLENKWAVDLGKQQIHTYWANLKDPSATKLYYGSVNDQLYQALNGNPNDSDLIPLPGDIDFISAGSPCQGFSMLNQFRNQGSGIRNQSLVASFAGYVDFYRPKYGLMENVLNMAQRGMGRDEDILAQLSCALVGLGYQVQLFLLDAWSCGSAQSRSRIFVSFAAPGYEPMKHPELSHAHPLNVKDRGLGKLANGETFSYRKIGPTPFAYRTAGNVVNDLPYIGDGRTNQCIPYPDHVIASMDSQARIESIPTSPRGMNLVKSWNEGKGVMTKEQVVNFPSFGKAGKPRLYWHNKSKAWGRIDPQGLFSIMTTSCHTACAFTGTLLHWDQHRTMTIMEGRRAQGFPDNELLLGSRCQKMRIVGNSVDRSVSLSLGLSLREAWLSCIPDEAQRARIPVPSAIRLSRPLDIKSAPRKQFHKMQKAGPRTVVPDSEESSDDKIPIDRPALGIVSVMPFRQSLGREMQAVPPPIRAPMGNTPTLAGRKIQAGSVSTPIRPLIIADMDIGRIAGGRKIDAAPIPVKTAVEIQVNQKSLKRPYNMVETRILPPEKNVKTPRFSASESGASSQFNITRPAASRKEGNTKAHPIINPSALHKKLQSILAQRVVEISDSSTDDDDDYDRDTECDSEGGDEVEGKQILASMFGFSGVPNLSQTLSKASIGRAKPPTTARPKNVSPIAIARPTKLQSNRQKDTTIQTSARPSKSFGLSKELSQAISTPSTDKAQDPTTSVPKPQMRVDPKVGKTQLLLALKRDAVAIFASKLEKFKAPAAPKPGQSKTVSTPSTGINKTLAMPKSVQVITGMQSPSMSQRGTAAQTMPSTKFSAALTPGQPFTISTPSTGRTKLPTVSKPKLQFHIDPKAARRTALPSVSQSDNATHTTSKGMTELSAALKPSPPRQHQREANTAAQKTSHRDSNSE